jgi:hypothetical protein
VFSPRYGWYEMPEELNHQFKIQELSWDYFGKYYVPTKSQTEMNVGYENNFFYFEVTKEEIL